MNKNKIKFLLLFVIMLFMLVWCDNNKTIKDVDDKQKNEETWTINNKKINENTGTIWENIHMQITNTWESNISNIPIIEPDTAGISINEP
jgi:hypothetical protein